MLSFNMYAVQCNAWCFCSYGAMRSRRPLNIKQWDHYIYVPVLLRLAYSNAERFICATGHLRSHFSPALSEAPRIRLFHTVDEPAMSIP